MQTGIPEIDVAIIGAGPSGLSAAAACKARGLNIIVFDQGQSYEVRSRLNPKLSVSGLGGAGLYSDGKISFFPSSTRLWGLEPRNILERSYSWLTELIRSAGYEAPPFTSIKHQEDNRLKKLKGNVFEKKYQSIKLNSTERTGIIANLRDICHAELLLSTRIKSIDWESEGVKLITASNGKESLFSSKAIIFSGGRIAPIWLCNHMPNREVRFDRLEIGLRIEQPAELFFFKDHDQLDPKIIWRSADDDVEWRTFCCCREGQVITGHDSGLTVVSGTSDTELKNYSNVGLTVRIETRDYADILIDDLFPRLRRLKEIIIERMDIFISEGADSKLRNLYGPEISNLLILGLNKLTELFPSFDVSRTNLYGPAVEGVGYYPMLDRGLKNNRLPLWVAGDATGLFRGLTAALVSGYFVGQRV